ncbi:MAG: DUF3656 domain-containing protein [Proteobacteria bacterium]|nr:DUF3656 domain-containing protein [Pseudomonadota bacterium]
MRLRETTEGFALTLLDETGVTASACLEMDKQAAQQAEQSSAVLREHLGKLGATEFSAESIAIELSADWFIPAARLNALRRAAVTALQGARRDAWQRPPCRPKKKSPAPQYPESALSYLGNVFNRQARSFYARHGVTLIDAAYEADLEDQAVPLMTTKHCLRYSFNLCPRQVSNLRPEPMTLIQGNEKLLLRFDCKKCEMQVIGKRRKNRAIKLAVISA